MSDPTIDDTFNALRKVPYYSMVKILTDYAILNNIQYYTEIPTEIYKKYGWEKIEMLNRMDILPL